MSPLDELFAWLDNPAGEDTMVRRAMQAALIDRPFWRLVTQLATQEDE